MNPELLRIDSGAQIGAKAIDVTSGAVLKNLTGVVDYTRQAYTILIDADKPPIIEDIRTFVPTSPAGEREVTVGSFNLENFFDDEKNSDNVSKETIYTEEVFRKKLNKVSLSIRNVLSNPDVLAVVEVENLKALQKLADKVNADEIAAGKPNPEYKAYLEEGNDVRGIDVGYLIKSSKVNVVKVEQLGKDVKLETAGAYPDEKLYDRPPLLISVDVDDAKTKQKFAFSVIVNHFKSYRGIDDAKDGDRVRNKRRLQAEWLAEFIAERAKTNPDERIIVCGDFNAFQFNDGYNDLIGILKGKSDPNVITPSSAAFQTGLIDLVERIEQRNRYSYIYNGTAQVLDHVLVNRNALLRGLKFGFARMNADFPKVYGNDEDRPERSSDHDAPVFYLSLDERQRAQ